MDKNKPLGFWPDQIKHEEVKSPQRKDEESALGKMPVSGSDKIGDVDEITKSMGIYDEENGSSENTSEVSIADEIMKNNQG